MIKNTTILSDGPQELKRLLRCSEKENDILGEQVRLLYAKLFGKKSEKGGPEQEKVEVSAHTREKAGRKRLPGSFLG